MTAKISDLIDLLQFMQQSQRGYICIAEAEREHMFANICQLESETKIVFGCSPSSLVDYRTLLQPPPVPALNLNASAASFVDRACSAMRVDLRQQTLVGLSHNLGCTVDLFYTNGILIEAIAVDEALNKLSALPLLYKSNSVPLEIAQHGTIVVRGTLTCASRPWQNKHIYVNNIMLEGYKGIFEVICGRPSASKLVYANLAFVAWDIYTPQDNVYQQATLFERLATLSCLGFRTPEMRQWSGDLDYWRQGTAVDSQGLLTDGWLICYEDTYKSSVLARALKGHAWTYAYNARWRTLNNNNIRLKFDIDEIAVDEDKYNRAFCGAYDRREEVQITERVMAYIRRASGAVVVDYVACPDSPQVDAPTKCPSCGRTLRVFHRSICPNEQCRSQFYGRLLRFVGEHGLRIPSLPARVLKRLLKRDLLDCLADLFTLSVGQLMYCGFAQAEASQIVEDIQLARARPLTDVLRALGLDDDSATFFGECYDSYNELLNSSCVQMMQKTGATFRKCTMCINAIHHNPEAAALRQWIL